MTKLLAGTADIAGLPFDPGDEATLEAQIDALGPARAYVEYALHWRPNLTSFNGGYMANVIPQKAKATADLRAIPDAEEAVAQRIAELTEGSTFPRSLTPRATSRPRRAGSSRP